MLSIKGSNLSHLFNEFTSFSCDINNTPENVINFNYYDNSDQLQTLKEFTHKSTLSLFHLNTCLLSKNIDGFEHLIQSIRTVFDIMTVSESKITRNKLPPIDITIPNYDDEFCPMETNAGVTLIYIRNHLDIQSHMPMELFHFFNDKNFFCSICYIIF